MIAHTFNIIRTFRAPHIFFQPPFTTTENPFHMLHLVEFDGSCHGHTCTQMWEANFNEFLGIQGAMMITSAGHQETYMDIPPSQKIRRALEDGCTLSTFMIFRQVVLKLSKGRMLAHRWHFLWCHFPVAKSCVDVHPKKIHKEGLRLPNRSILAVSAYQVASSMWVILTGVSVDHGLTQMDCQETCSNCNASHKTGFLRFAEI